MEKNKGSITIEMSIVLPIFIFIFLFINGFFSIITAHNTMTHALIQTSKSLAMDPYMTESVASITEYELKDKVWENMSDILFDFVRSWNNPAFSSTTDWYKISDNDLKDVTEEEKIEKRKAGANNVAKERFVGFLAGGDYEKADTILKNLKIDNGLDGLSINVSVSDKDLSVNLKYKIQYWFDFLGMGVFDMNQTIKTTLWK